MADLELDLLAEPFAVVRLEAGSGCPDWARDSGWLSLTRSDSETSIVCHERVVPGAARAQRGLRCLRVRGPLSFSQTGVLEALAHPLATAGIPIFVLSTYETDHLLVAGASLEPALQVLSQAGHRIHGPPAAGPPPGAPEKRPAAAPVTVIGSYLSPYVRKVLVCLDLKGVPYQIDPIVPFYGNDEFTRVSPVRRVPVLVDGPLTLPDSSAICAYLEERHPEPPLLPADPALRARARWIEEYADTRMGEVFIWRLFNQTVINRFVWGASTDPEVVRRAVEEEIPEILDYLEREVPAQGFLFGDLGVADIALAAFFRNAAFARFSIDAKRWPGTSAFVARVLEQPSFVELRRFEELLMRTPIDRHREALAEAGAPLTPRTLGSDSARRGILST